MIKEILFALATALPIAAFAQAGAINTTTGEFYAPAGPAGVIDTTTGEFFPKTGPGYTNPRIGEFYQSLDPPRVPPNHEPADQSPEPESQIQEPEIPRTYQAAATGGSGEIYCGEDDLCVHVKGNRGGYAPYCGEDDDC